MAEYIKREALLEKCHWVIRSDGTRVYVCHAEDIETALAADVAPVRHGQWIPVDEENDAFDCSECDVMVTRKYNFCPKCGAKMDLEPVL